MKSLKSVLMIFAASVLMSACSSAYYATVSAGDGMYGVHDTVAIAKRQEAAASRVRAQAVENLYSEYASAPNYSSVVADTYESAYARRLYGFRSSTYRLPSSYYDFRYGDAYHYVTAYDPALYNIMVSGDQVWVEPKYISSMFGTWGATNMTFAVGNWYFGWAEPFYYGAGAWWGYPRYSWWDWNWGICYNPYHTWWGYGWGPGWGHPHWGWGPGYYPPHHGVGRPPHHGAGHGGQPPRREQLVNRPSYTSPSSGKSYGSRQPMRGTVNGSGVFDRGTGSAVNSGVAGVRGAQNGSGVSRGTTSQSGRTTGSSSSAAERNRRGTSSFFNRNENDTRNSINNSVNPWGNTNSGNSSFGSGSSSSGGFSGGSSGGHRGGNSLGR